MIASIKLSLRILIVAGIPFGFLFFSSCYAAEGKPDWFLDTGSQGRAVLYFGEKGSDEQDLVLSCKVHTGRIRIFVGETDPSLKPYARTEVLASAGTYKSKISGRTLPNELANVPSFQADLPASDGIFEVTSSAKFLVLKVGLSRQEIPLDTIADKMADFSKACRKM
jgi:hypothetical protein